VEGPFVSVVIVNYNGQPFLGECLESVYAQDYPQFEVIVVDNGSHDGSPEWVRRHFPSVRLFSLGSNRGFAYGANFGARQARGDIVVLLNPDTRVEQGWLRWLIKPLMENEQVAVVSSKVITEGINPRYFEKNGTLSLLGYNIMEVFADPTVLFYATGCSLAYRKSLLGLPFDEDYFLYAEDVHLSLRARFLGYEVRQVPESLVYHRGGRAVKHQPSRRMTFYQERNRLLNLLIFFDRKLILRLVPFLVLDFVAKILASLLLGRKSPLGILEAYSWLVRHRDMIRTKREQLKVLQKVPEEQILAWMSCHLLNGEGAIPRLVNALARQYCRWVNIPTVELQN